MNSMMGAGGDFGGIDFSKLGGGAGMEGLGEMDDDKDDDDEDMPALEGDEEEGEGEEEEEVPATKSKIEEIK